MKFGSESFHVSDEFLPPALEDICTDSLLPVMVKRRYIDRAGCKKSFSIVIGKIRVRRTSGILMPPRHHFHDDKANCQDHNRTTATHRDIRMLIKPFA